MAHAGFAVRGKNATHQRRLFWFASALSYFHFAVLSIEGVSLSGAYSSFTLDLTHFPNNAYSLWGQLQAMKAQPDKYTSAQVAEVTKAMDTAWARGQIPLSSSCIFMDPM